MPVRALVSVSEFAVIDDVAVMVEARTSPPLNTPEPFTERAREGDVVKLVTPVGVQDVEVVEVRYPAPVPAQA